ncbi:MAG: TIR domain-containing protein [Geminicoccaceae bacterium]
MSDGTNKQLIFISYSSFDMETKEFVQRHFGVLQHLGDVEIWEDSQIDLGDDWFQEIETKLETCSVAVLLISHDFLGSKFCMQKEIPVLLERRKRDGMMIAPILLSPCAWDIIPWLSAIQMLPRKSKPLLALDDIEQAEKLAEVVRTIHAFLERHRESVAKADVAPQIELKADTPYEKPLAIDITRLPTSGFDVVGRDKELQFLNEAFDGDQLNVVSLRAWGGVGKSTLVNKWCEYLAADNYRGARRVFAWSFYSQGTNERVTSADVFIDEALRFFGEGEPAQGSPWARGERLAELVGNEKALLILDGMEPLQDEHQGIKDPALARLVECLAEKNAGLCVITTREPVKEFTDFPDTTQEIDLEQLSIEAGRALLRIEGLRATDELLEQASKAFSNHALALNLLAS